MSAQKRIGDLVEVPPVKTVIRLDEGRESSTEIAESFVFTPEVSAHLNVIVEALQAGRGQGYFLQGDFGSGKSHFLAMLYTWLSGRTGAERLSTAYQGFGRAAEKGGRILPAAVSLINYRSGTPLESIILESVEKSLDEVGTNVSLTHLSAFLNWLQDLLEEPETAKVFAELAGFSMTGVTAAGGPTTGVPAAGESAAGAAVDSLAAWISENPRQAYAAGLRLVKKLGLEAPQALVEERHESFGRVFSELGAAGFDGLFLLIDELSEFFRSKPSAQSLNEDARTLQFLGELTAERPLWIVAAVQESIERTGDIAQTIMRKIKDRFPVKLTLSTVHIRSLISERLVHKKPGAEEEIFSIYEHYRKQFSTFSCSFEEFRNVYPVHPATISLLDGLGELFSQHRGIVDFVYSRIAGDSRRNIPSILERPDRELLGPDSIYDHFSGRLAEFSSYNIYPRHIIPHLEQEIERILENGEDRYMAKRLVRMLVLYRIHPTADTPTAAGLAEMAACSLDVPDMNARFVSEALLEPLASSSRFLSKKSDGDPARAVYEITTEEDPGKVLEGRIERIAGEVQVEDSRLLLEPLFQLPQSDSWPGTALGREGAVREINWNSSQRKGLVRFLHREDTLPARLAHELDAGGYDFALVITLGEVGVEGEYIAVWQIPFPEQGESLETLREFLAVRLTLEELSPSNPAQAPLIPLARERLERLKPAASQAALQIFYTGDFSDPRIRVDAAVRQLKRFDRLMEQAGEIILSERYPRFAEVAPRRYPPSPRIYQQLLEAFIIPGSLALAEARSRSLSAAIDGLAVPLGLVELRRGSYLFSPDTSGHPLLLFFFELLRPASSVSLSEVLKKLQSGLFGLPRDTALFLLASLAAGGLITVRRGGRALALEFLSLQSLERAEEIALGELIGEHDRATLLKECSFLSTASGWESFGLKQQRETWKEVIKFRNTAERLAGESLARLRQRREYSSFKNFRIASLEEKMESLGRLASEIRVSYSAKEGLEKFLSAWRTGGLSGEDVHFLQKLESFLDRGAEKFVFISHYMRHEAAGKATQLEADLETSRLRILELLESPEEAVVADEGAEMDSLFGAFRDRYIPLYARLHSEYYASFRRPSLSKSASRALATLSRLAGIEVLDRPPGLDRFLKGQVSPQVEQCNRQIREELMRAPVCGCGFLPGQIASVPEAGNPEAEIDRYLNEYLGILKNPSALESVTSHAYALRDINPRISIHLKEMGLSLESGALSASGLVKALDEGTVYELSRALSGKLSIRRASLGELVKRLAGRRLPPDRILSLVSEWLGKGGEGDLVAVEDARPFQPGKETEYLHWWPLLNSEYFPRLSHGGKDTVRAARDLEVALEERFPSAHLAESLRALDQEELLHFITSERFHTLAIQNAWLVLAERILAGSGIPRKEGPRSRHADPERAEEIEGRLSLAGEIGERLSLPYPGRLAVRLPLEAILSDSWTTEELRATALKTLKEVESLGQGWLEGLKPVEPIRLEQGPLVLLIDGVPPDIWLEAMEQIEALPGALSKSWARLEASPETVEATARLFGFGGDPAEAFAERGISYICLKGNEERPLADQVESLAQGEAAAVRLSTLDRGAHSGTYKLAEMAAVMRQLLKREIAVVLRLCARQKRSLILTTDHGLSLGRKGLSHGRGGVYEQAIFRATWAS